MMDAPAQFSCRSNTDIAATSSGQADLKSAETSTPDAYTAVGVLPASEPLTGRMTF